MSEVENDDLELDGDDEFDGEEEGESDYEHPKVLPEEVIEKISEKDVKFVRDFFTKNPDMKKERGGNYEQVTALGFALYEDDNFEMVKMLVEEIGVDVNQTSYHYVRHGIERCPIGIITTMFSGSKTEEEVNKFRKILDYLISHGANINPDNKTVSYMPLMDASNDASMEIIKCLVDRGAMVDIEGVGLYDTFTYNPIYFASLGSRLDVCKYLLKNGSTVHFSEIMVTTQHFQHEDDVDKYEELIKNEVAILLLLQQEFLADCYFESVWERLKEVFFENEEKRRRLVYEFGDDEKFRFRDVWSPKTHKKYPKPFQRFVMMMLWIHKNPKSSIHEIPTEVIVFHILPYMNEYFVLLSFLEKIERPVYRNVEMDGEEEGEEEEDLEEEEGEEMKEE